MDTHVLQIIRAVMRTVQPHCRSSSLAPLTMCHPPQKSGRDKKERASLSPGEEVAQRDRGAAAQLAAAFITMGGAGLRIYAPGSY